MKCGDLLRSLDISGGLMLEWEQSSQQFQSNTLCSVTALRAKSLYTEPKTAVLTSEELCCSDMTPVWKHVLCFQMTTGMFWLFSIRSVCEWVSSSFSRWYCSNLSRLKQIWWHTILVYISQVFKWLSITSDGLLVTVNAHSSDSVCIDAKRTLKNIYFFIFRFILDCGSWDIWLH